MAIAGVNHLWFHIVILMSIFAISRSDDPPPNCVYTFYIQTGPWFFAGTDSKISVTFSDSGGNSIIIGNIETWGGRMGPGHEYFEKGDLDIFSGKGPCLPGPVCSLKLTSDGSGSFPAWYVKYLQLTTTGDQKACGQRLFTLEQWLLPPFGLTAVRNNCRKAFATEDVSYGLPSIIAHAIE